MIKSFNPDKYKKTGWIPIISHLQQDDYKPRLIIRVATGRKYWPLFSEVINPNLGLNDPALIILKNSLYFYTHPMVNRFINELNIMINDIYEIEINFDNL